MLKLKTWKETLDFMYQRLPMYQRIGAAAYKKDLTNTILLCEACGNPHRLLKCVHIAGTNGKGTTTHIIASGLQSQGYNIGVYTSPHYVDFRERIKINGLYISKKYIISFINTYIDEIETIQPSFFELTVALAFRYFADQKVDFAVIETGLGGRLDSTNVITPLISVITNISYDHQSMLGHTLPLIAAEKAGIIKQNIPVVIGESQEDVQEVFIKKSKEVHAPLIFADQHLSLVQKSDSGSELVYDVYLDNKLWLNNLRSSLIGPFQSKNIITGLYALKELSKMIPSDFNKVIEVFPEIHQQTGYMGRWQILDKNPLVVVDSAHNTGGISIVVDELKKFKEGRLHIIMGFVNDKDISEILNMMPQNAAYYFAKANIPRGLDAVDLKNQAKNAGLKGNSYISVRKAFAAARQKAKKGDTIFIGGSIFVVGEVLKTYIEKQKINS